MEAHRRLDTDRPADASTSREAMRGDRRHRNPREDELTRNHNRSRFLRVLGYGAKGRPMYRRGHDMPELAEPGLDGGLGLGPQHQQAIACRVQDLAALAFAGELPGRLSVGVRPPAWNSDGGRAGPPQETPVGVEPTWTGLQPVAWPRGSGAIMSMSSPGVEPGLRPSHGRVLIRHTPRAGIKPTAGLEPAWPCLVQVSQILRGSAG